VPPTPDRPDGGGSPPPGWYPPTGWYPPHGWHQPPGWYPPPAPPRRRSRAAVAGTVGGIVLAVALLGVIAVAGFDMGRSIEDLGATSSAAVTTTPADPSTLGDDPGLDAYAQRCHDGEMDACDDLAALSDVMTRYEQYGVTCGGRIKAVEVFTCTQLE
jgi:hypothetical protein